MRENPQACITGVRLEPVCSLNMNTIFCYEVLSQLAPEVNAEQFFRILSPDRAADIFICQVQFIRTFFSSGCFTFNLPAKALISGMLLRSLCAEMNQGLIVEIQDPKTVMLMSRTEIELLTDNLRNITGKGVKIWLDDVTPEMTDFFLGLRLPLAGVKTDRSVLHRFSADGKELSSLVEKCRQLAPLVIVEGIETIQMKHHAIYAGAHAGQGYLWPGKTLLYSH
ncbi:EAL domain-containing protein [Citrobacter meridianamericanus]